MMSGARRLLVVGCLAFFASACGVLGGSDSSEAEPVFLEAAAALGPDPFLVEAVSIAPDPLVAQPVNASLEIDATAGTSVSRGGGDVGLYGGSTNRLICDQAKMVEFLTRNPDKAAAWVSAFNADPTFSHAGGALTVAEIGNYVNSLVPVVLTQDTRVTNHGFKNGNPTPRQSVIQKGTAVLVDAFGVPRVKCLCGNPLLPPKPTQGKYTGPPWPDFDPDEPIIVGPHPEPLPTLPTVDIDTGNPLPMPVPTPPGPGPLEGCNLGDVQARRGDQVPLGGDTGQFVRVNDDCTTTLISCYFTDATGVLQQRNPGEMFDFAGDTYTFKQDCTFDTGSPPGATTSTTGGATPQVCPVTLRDGSTYDAFPGEEFWWLRSTLGGGGAVVEIGDWYQVAGDCTLTLAGCAVFDPAVGLERYYQFNETFDFDGSSFGFDQDCFPQAAPAPATSTTTTPGSAAPATPAQTYCSPTGQGTALDITFINNTQAEVAVWWHDFNCNPQLMFTLPPGAQLVQGSFTDHFWSVNAISGAELSTYAPVRPGAKTHCADPAAVC